MAEYELVENFPDAQEYVRLRERAGMSPRSLEAARLGLPATWYGVSIRRDGQCVGMGRVIGDGGCFFQVVDIAVLPEHQARGLGTRIMQALVDRLRAEAPATSIATLLADGTAHKLYEKFGFVESAPDSIGMILRL